MNTYLRRSVKYFVALCVLCMALIALNLTTGMAALSFEQTLYAMFHTPRGLLLPATIVVLAALYPRFGFSVRRIEGDTERHRTQIEQAFRSAGFSLCCEEDETLVFRADGFVRRLAMLYEDEVRVSQYGQWIVLEGNRRGVARAAYRLESYLQMIGHDEQEHE